MPDAFDPRSALDLAQDARNRLANRVTTPWWYHPALSLFFVLACLGIGLPKEAVGDDVSTIMTVLSCAGSLTIMSVYRRITGLWIQRTTGPRTHKLLVGFAVVVTISLIFSAANRLWLDSWWVLVALSIGALIAVPPFGRHYDNVLRSELRAGGSR
ncbi:hypothetical protein [Austwickia chelonae]|uniref:hypothetical protein n=1 Tax=Austwickia chelonae TaxID=100225 RepID=UPI000E22AA4D|nr:hypothetical protein [Austwickia chelonae]